MELKTLLRPVLPRRVTFIAAATAVACIGLVQPAYSQTPLSLSGGLNSVASTTVQPTFYGLTAGNTFLAGHDHAWDGTVSRTGSGTASGVYGTTTFGFSALANGYLPCGTYVVMSDVDTGSGDHETITLKAYQGNTVITGPWLDTPIAKWGTPATCPLPSCTYSAGQYIFDGNAVSGQATVGFCLRTNVPITKVVVVKSSAYCGMGFAAPGPMPLNPPVCCPGVNVLKNDSFDFGNTGFASQFGWNPGPFPGVMLGAGQFTVGNGSTAIHINPTWSVWDQATQSPYAGNLLIANLGGLLSRVLWGQTFTLSGSKVYSLCARVKALGNSPANVMFQVNGANLPLTTVTPGGGPGVWQEVSASIGPIGGPVTVKLFANGAGALAIDNVTMIETTTTSSPTLVELGLSTSVPTNGHFAVTASYPGVPGNYGYFWEIQDLTNSTSVVNPSAWWTETLGSAGMMPFRGYQSSNNLSGNAPGTFVVGHHYVISYGVWSKCTLWTASHWDISFAQDLRAPGKPVVKRVDQPQGISMPIFRTVQPAMRAVADSVGADGK